MRQIKNVRRILATNYHFLKNVRKVLSINKRAFLLGTPCHSNMGDQAQTYCSIRWIEDNYPGYRVVPVQTNEVLENNERFLHFMRKIIGTNDLIFLHSGYHTTDIYPMEEIMQRRVIQQFADKKIVIFPQTIMFKDLEYQKKSAEIYNDHPDLTLMCRDDISYEIAQQVFSKCKLLCFPDIVTTLIGTKKYDNNRSGILFCMRNDAEAFYKPKQILELRNKLEKYDSSTMTDTTIAINPNYIRKNREKVLTDIFSDYSKYRLMITDRYHGTIFSMIAATPVIVLGTTDHKLSSGVKWFPDEFKKYIYFVNNLQEVESIVEQIYNAEFDYKHPQYFNDEYYSKLKSLL